MIPTTASAQRHVQCTECARLIRVANNGAGLGRKSDTRIRCGKCFAEAGPSYWNLDGQRYGYFEDGVLIDWNHYRWSKAITDFTMAFGDVIGLNYFQNAMTGMLVANGLGYLVELNQYENGSPSGHPFGGNEDLLSNFSGSLVGALTSNSNLSTNWVEQSLPILEFFHGDLEYVSNENRNIEEMKKNGTK